MAHHFTQWLIPIPCEQKQELLWWPNTSSCVGWDHRGSTTAQEFAVVLIIQYLQPTRHHTSQPLVSPFAVVGQMDVFNLGSSFQLLAGQASDADCLGASFRWCTAAEGGNMYTPDGCHWCQDQLRGSQAL
jgi:hypothetical protein